MHFILKVQNLHTLRMHLFYRQYVLKFQHCIITIMYIQCWNFVILEQSMGARNRVEIGLSSLELISGLLKSLKIPSQAKSLVRRGIIL
jgi:hypothetical protein